MTITNNSGLNPDPYCQARKLNKEDAMDRCKWRKVIKEAVDPDVCEWVNVFSGTGLPELSRIKGR